MEAEKTEKTAEEEEKAMTSMRLAYQDLSIEKKKQASRCYARVVGKSTRFFLARLA